MPEAFRRSLRACAGVASGPASARDGGEGGPVAGPPAPTVKINSQVGSRTGGSYHPNSDEPGFGWPGGRGRWPGRQRPPSRSPARLGAESGVPTTQTATNPGSGGREGGVGGRDSGVGGEGGA